MLLIYTFIVTYDDLLTLKLIWTLEALYVPHEETNEATSYR